jgi:hypothetical protein
MFEDIALLSHTYGRGEWWMRDCLVEAYTGTDTGPVHKELLPRAWCILNRVDGEYYDRHWAFMSTNARAMRSFAPDSNFGWDLPLAGSEIIRGEVVARNEPIDRELHPYMRASLYTSFEVPANTHNIITRALRERPPPPPPPAESIFESPAMQRAVEMMENMSNQGGNDG